MKKRFDDVLYQEVPKIVDKELERLPKEEELNHVFSDAFEQRMDDLMTFPTEKRVRFLHRISLGRSALTAAVCLIIVLGAVTTVFAVQPTRNAVFHFLQRKWTEFTSFLVYEEPTSQDTDTEEWVWYPIEPEPTKYGFHEISRTRYEQLLNIDYQNDEGQDITYSTHPLGAEQSIVDTENTTLHQKVINGLQIFYVEKNNWNTVLWYDMECGYVIAGNVDTEILLKLVDEMTAR